MPDVVAGAGFFKLAIVEGDTGAATIVIAIVESLAILIEGIEGETLGIAALGANHAGMMRVVAVIGVVLNLAKLLVRLVILGGVEDLVEDGRIC